MPVYQVEVVEGVRVAVEVSAPSIDEAVSMVEAFDYDREEARHVGEGRWIVGVVPKP